jgi:hypothetical protein
MDPQEGCGVVAIVLLDDQVFLALDGTMAPSSPL